MQKSIIATTAVFLMISAFTPYASAGQTSGQPSKLDVVEVVGCLSEEPKGTWRVTSATDPIVSKTPYTNEAAIKAAEAKPLGSHQYGLIAISMFNPDAHRGHKVAVKGLLIKDPKGDRLNVTSLQMASATCR